MTSNQEITSTRTFNYPVGQVYKAWSNPDHLVKWWGPKGFSNTFQQFDFRPEGKWDFIMHGPDGNDYPNHCQFVEIVPNEKIVFDHIEPVHSFRVTATFKDVEGGTQLVFRMVFDDAEECQRVRQYVEPANEENFDRLEGVLGEK